MEAGRKDIFRRSWTDPAVCWELWEQGGRGTPCWRDPMLVGTTCRWDPMLMGPRAGGTP